MRVLKRSWLTAGVVVSALAFASQADATVYDGMTIAQVEAALTAAGQTFKVVNSNILQLEQGRNLLLASCPDQASGVCYEIYVIDTFNVKPTLQAVNQWNANFKAPEASVNDDGLLELTMFVTTVGITEKLLLDTLSWLDTAEKEQAAFWRPYAPSPTS